MLDALRRLVLGSDVRRIDVSMLIIEALVLLLILAEFIWRVSDACQERRVKKQDRQRLLSQLATLSPTENAEFKRWVLENGGNPTSDEKLIALHRKLPYMISRDFTGVCIVEEHKPFLQKWAKGNEGGKPSQR